MSIWRIGPWPADRQIAISLGSKFYCTPEPCKRGHVAPRKTNNRVCMECILITQDEAAIRRYNASEKGREKNRRNQRRLRGCDDKREVLNEKTKKYLKTDRGREVHNIANRRYREKLRLAKHYDLFMARLEAGDTELLS